MAEITLDDEFSRAIVLTIQRLNPAWLCLWCSTFVRRGASIWMRLP
jgi:hypothetical protein